MAGQIAVVSLSGGLDSAVALAQAVQDGFSVRAVSFQYPSKHNVYELKSAQDIASHFRVPHKVISVEGIFASFKSDLLTNGGDIPEGHYEDKSMERTVVPGRNIIFASILAGVAWSEYKARSEIGPSEHHYAAVVLGIHAGDHAIYPDCRPDFFDSLRSAVIRGTGHRVVMDAPFINISKQEIIQLGVRLRVPFILTRTCYKDQPIACGKCGSCQERLAAFRGSNVTDPLDYETREILPKE